MLLISRYRLWDLMVSQNEGASLVFLILYANGQMVRFLGTRRNCSCFD